MKKNTEPLFPGKFYHIYNRGINRESIFKNESNYSYFLQKFTKYISPIAETYAYCLLNNHFHFLIRTKEEDAIEELGETSTRFRTSSTLEDWSASFIIGNQFAKLFNSYTQSINKVCNRTGGLFEKPFRRAEVNSDEYFTVLVAYIHFNPQKHGYVNDFREYKYSSYFSLICESKKTKLKRNEVLEWFGGKEAFIKYHKDNVDFARIKSIVLE